MHLKVLDAPKRKHKMRDITLKTIDGYFNYRVGAIIIHKGHVLMVRNENYPYYYSVGGRVRFGETSAGAVLREVFEETNINFEIDRLAFVHENFFFGDFMGEHFQEIAFFFLMKFNDKIENINCNSKGMDGGKEALHWLPINNLSEYNLFPEFFKSELQNLTDKVKHFITKDEITKER